MSSLSNSSRSDRSNFRQIVVSFLLQSGLPFADILSAERIERIFAKHDNLFGVGAIYSTAVMVWSFLSQVLRDGKEASCQAAVARVVAHREQRGADSPKRRPRRKSMCRYQVVEKGCRTQTLTVVTTLTDVEVYSKEEIAELYGFRWNAELDIRSIKQSLNLGHLRCKSPEMVRKELWTTILGYNLIRTTAAAAARLHNKLPRQIGFTSTCQYVLASWMLFSCELIAPNRMERHCRLMLFQIAQCEVANRPGRIEPRVLKRRRHGYKLMQEPRHVLKQRLIKGNTM